MATLRPSLHSLAELSNRVITPGICRVCGCTEDAPCIGGCGWIDVDLCSTCAETVLACVHLAEEAGPATTAATPRATFRKLIAELQRIETDPINPWPAEAATEEPSRLILPG